jgi:hypothetical protein
MLTRIRHKFLSGQTILDLQLRYLLTRVGINWKPVVAGLVEGDGVLNVEGCSVFTLQAVTLGDCTYKLQQSLDNVSYVDIAGGTITADGFSTVTSAANFLKVVKTAGAQTTAVVFVRGRLA